MGMLDGKTALVTGAGRGIGRGIAIALAAAGAKVVVNDLGASLSGEGRENTPAQTVVDEIIKYGGTATANYGSVADFGQAAAMVQQAIDAWGRIDIVVHVAGILRDRMIFNMTEETFEMGERPAGFDPLDPANISPVVVALCADDAQEITGQVFHVWGGAVNALQGWTGGELFQRDDGWDADGLLAAMLERFPGGAAPEGMVAGMQKAGGQSLRAGS